MTYDLAPLPTMPSIHTHGTSKGDPNYDKFYIHMLVKSTEDTTGVAARYLHKDGNWRDTTVHNGESTGFFNTYEEAAGLLLGTPIAAD